MLYLGTHDLQQYEALPIPVKSHNFENILPDIRVQGSVKLWESLRKYQIYLIKSNIELAVVIC